MPIKVPGKRYGKRLERSKVFGGGGHAKKNGFADLLVTPLVDMFVIIVLFLIANFSATGEVLNMTNDIILPEATHVKEIELAPVVMVSGTEVTINSKTIGTIDELTRDENYLNIPALEEELRVMKKQYEDLHALANDTDNAFKGDINIQGHKDVQWKIIKRVMFSCATAGYGNINFATLTKGGPQDGAAVVEGTGATAATGAP